MSKPVRLADYLYEQVARLAAAEKRSTANMVQVLLEQALKMNGPAIQPAGTGLSERGGRDSGVAQLGKEHRHDKSEVGSSSLPAGGAVSNPRMPRSESPDDHFKPDFKKGKK